MHSFAVISSIQQLLRFKVDSGILNRIVYYRCISWGILMHLSRPCFEINPFRRGLLTLMLLLMLMLVLVLMLMMLLMFVRLLILMLTMLLLAFRYLHPSITSFSWKVFSFKMAQLNQITEAVYR